MSVISHTPTLLQGYCPRALASISNTPAGKANSREGRADSELLFSKYWAIRTFCTSRSDVLICPQVLLSRDPRGLPANSYTPLQRAELDHSYYEWSKNPLPVLCLAPPKDTGISTLCTAPRATPPSPATHSRHSPPPRATLRVRLQCHSCCCSGGRDRLVLPTHGIAKRWYGDGFQQCKRCRGQFTTSKMLFLTRVPRFTIIPAGMQSYRD